jgi:hypothetical protein
LEFHFDDRKASVVGLPSLPVAPAIATTGRLVIVAIDFLVYPKVICEIDPFRRGDPWFMLKLN